MYYKPHTLQVLRTSSSRDAYNRVTETSGYWRTVGRCRCDDDGSVEIQTEGGHMFRSRYHIVAEGTVDVREGDEVRVLRDDGSIRGEGKILRGPIHLNKLSYTNIWV